MGMESSIVYYNIMRQGIWILLMVIGIAMPLNVLSQCNNWSIASHLIASSSCAGNGSFSVTLSGTDLANLTDIQYGIPLSANGFSVPLNNAATFNNIPAGTYQVSAVAMCNGTYVGKNTSITVPGNYLPLTFSPTLGRPSIDCAATGVVNFNMTNGLPPYTVHITSAPAAYNGPRVFTFSSTTYTTTSLPAGQYTFQAIDNCLVGSAAMPILVSAIDNSTIPILYGTFGNRECDTLMIPMPAIDENNGLWGSYEFDTLYSISAQIPILGINTPFSYLRIGSFVAPLPTGKTLKDCYGKVVNYTLRPPCGADILLSQRIPYPNVAVGINKDCSSHNFKGLISFTGPVCYPVIYSLVNTSTSITYGPYVTNSAADSTPVLPDGSYTVSFTTNDGYTDSGQFVATQVAGNPYSVSLVNGSFGLENYIDGFVISTNRSSSSLITVELFSGPAGYSFVGTGILDINNTFYISQNQTPVGYGKLQFPAGNYVWKVTDKCGSYLLPITVGASDLYQYTAGVDHEHQTCQGLWVYPTGIATNNGQSIPVAFFILKDGDVFDSRYYHVGDSFLLTMPGAYTILTTSRRDVHIIDSGYGYVYIAYPNAYTTSYSFTYTVNPVAADLNNSQGFLCSGAHAGQGIIYVKGQNGFPYINPIHYNYALAAAGNGAFGPYIDSNTTGIFTAFGGNANDIYDLKIEDSCGAFAVQQLKILDLQHSRLISSSKYVSCMGGSVQLSAIFLPGATYSWTGPAGFTSTLRSPVINNLVPSAIGVYYVTIITPICMLPVTDSTILTFGALPPKPLVSIDCNHAPPDLTIINATSTYRYQWYIDLAAFGYSYSDLRSSDSNYTKYAHAPGIYNAIATDTTTGCFSLSDSLSFSYHTNVPFKATIYSPHLQLCTGDTTVLVAQGAMLGNAGYQWFKNDVVIPGATSVSYLVWQPGNYKVCITAGPCAIDTSANVTVNVISPPVATISASAREICAGDSAIITSATGPGYTYTWYLNDSTIPSNTSYVVRASLPGSYNVVVSNGGCIAVSPVIPIIVDTAPIVNIQPNTNQLLCTGDVLIFTTNANAAYTYTWEKSGVIIPSATANTYRTTAAGTYQVSVRTGRCPVVISQPVTVVVLPVSVGLGNDTVVCTTGPFTIPLHVDTGFSQVLWSTGATTNNITVASAGTYWVQATNKCGVFTDSVNVYTPANYQITLPADTLVCNINNSSVFSIPSLLNNIRWSTGSTTPSITVSKPGIYWVQAQSPCGTVTDTMDVHFCPPQIQNIELSNDTICAGDCIHISDSTAYYPQQFYWYFGGALQDSSFAREPGIACYPKEGVYPIQLTVKNAGGNASLTRQVVVLSKPVPRFADTTISVPYKSGITLSPCADAQYISWYLNDSLLCANCQDLIIDAKYYYNVYHCVVSNGSCTDSCLYKLQVVDIPHDLWLPDAFTPNGDGKNDIFRIITDNPNVQVINLEIYNRWGQLLFISRLGNEGWDGTFHGVPAEMGSYSWMIRYRIWGAGDAIYFKKGSVELIR